MEALHIILDVADDLGFVRITKGTKEGKSAVMVEMRLPDGRVAIAQTTMVLFLTAAKMFAAKEQG